MYIILLIGFTWSMSTILNTVYLFYIPYKFEINDLLSGLIISLNFVAILLGSIVFSPLMKKLKLKTIINIIILTSVISCLLASLLYENLPLIILLTMLYVIFNIWITYKKHYCFICLTCFKEKTYSYFFTTISISSIVVSIIEPLLFNISIDNMKFIYAFIGIFQLITYIIIFINKNILSDNTSYSHNKNSKVKSYKLLNFKLLFGIGGFFLAIFQISYLLPKNIELQYSLNIYSLFLAIHTLTCIISPSLLIRIFKRKNENQIIIISGIFLIISLQCS